MVSRIVLALALAAVAAVSVVMAFSVYYSAPAYRFPPSNCKCVAFRLDDVQDYYLSAPQQSVMNMFESRKVPLTIGIIGNYFGADPHMVAFVGQKSSARGLFELANHGWNHEDFTTFSKAEQTQLMNRTSTKLASLYGLRPVTFITPYNTLNHDTVEAAKANGIRFISANTTTAFQPYASVTSDVVQVPGTTWHDYDRGIWFPYSHNEIGGQIDYAMRTYGFAVVVIHPQIFAVKNGQQLENEVDDAGLSELGKVIDYVQASGYHTVTISQVG